jgi:histidinol-phosphate aminotransferase
MLLPYSDFTEMLTDMLGHVAEDRDRLVVAGHATPEVQIAADRAGMQAVETIGRSPFVAHPEDLLDSVRTDSIVYLANPNPVTGVNYSGRALQRVAEALPAGALLLDEKYFDYYGITGLGLIENHPRVMVLRSFTAGFGIGSDDSGLLIAAPTFVRSVRSVYGWSQLSSTLCRMVATSLLSDDAARKRLAEVRDESLRVATELTRQGVQNRITATDFLLLRVADPKQVGNHLAAHNAPVENLDGYPGLKHYMRYRIQWPLSNDRFLRAFSRMPREYYHLNDLDKRAVMFHRAATPSAGTVKQGAVVDRNIKIPELAK